METKTYFHRLDASGETFESPDIDALSRLQRLHIQTVPFTNFYVRRFNGASLDPAEVVPRIIASGGGLCYDLNSGFAWLLTELGYDVTLISGRVKRDDGSFGPEYDHLALLVDDHLVDVGFGDFARQPLPLNGDPHTDVSGTYRVVTRDDHHAAQKQTDDCWKDEYRFTLSARTLDEFVEMADYHSTSPDSPFTGPLLATRATENGRVTLSGSTLTTKKHGEQTKQHVPPERVDDLLRGEFGLS
ncbi:arylamine N-acetyltransferase family protein [Halocatena halophila]|uniref:arylamine N-acetyltransferase family protein n=1 Tax=Halocatena halophila TaxID=2814576 RepID=UPI002ED5817F